MVGLGQLIYWFCCVVAVLLVLLALPGLMEPLRLPVSDPAESSTNYFQLGAAVMVWVVGLAVRYILKGR